MNINKTTIKQQIIEGNIKKAIEMLLKLGEQYDADIHNEAIMLSSRYNSLEKDKDLGIITHEAAEINKNRINFTLTQMLVKVDDTWNIQETTTGNIPSSNKKTILFLAANPQDSQRLRLDVEAREIEEHLRRSQDRERFKLVKKGALRVPDLRSALLDEKPNIIHFSGHGSEYGRLILEDGQGNSQEVPPRAIGNLFELFKDDIECVLLNACYSESQAQEIAKHIPFVIGMNTAILDTAAIEFSSAFYDAVGNGRDIEFAFKLARNAIEFAGIRGEQIPVLLK